MNTIIIAHAGDNVATCTQPLHKGQTVSIPDAEITVCEEVPVYHKVAVADIAAGAPVLKYGEVIGLATEDIRCGAYVHVHNVESNRGRGDRKDGE